VSVRTSLRPGALLAARYEVLRLIGTGARKQVHVAHDTWLDRDVAVCAVQGDPDEAARLRREAALLARLGDHPCIVGVHDLLEVDGAPVMICQYLPGGALHEALHGAPLAVDAALRIASDVAAALSRAHAHRVVHRDVKPANIWLDGTGARCWATSASPSERASTGSRTTCSSGRRRTPLRSRSSGTAATPAVTSTRWEPCSSSC
jgi:serine/threonine protein kinase